VDSDAVDEEKVHDKAESCSNSRIDSDSSTLFSTLQDTLTLYASEHLECSKYVPMIEKYMRFKFSCFGIKAPPRRTLLKKFVARFDTELHNFDILAPFLRELWEAKEREFQGCAVDLMVQFKDVLLGRGFDEAVGVVQHCIVNKSWWDTVDAISYPGI